MAVDELKSKKKNNALLYVSIALIVILVASIIAVTVSFTCFTTYIVEGDSMNPTLSGGVRGVTDDGEKLILNKVAKIHKGDIIVFTNNWLSYESAFVKRVIAAAGDHVKIENGEVYINGTLLNEPYIQGKTYSDYSDFIVPSGEFFCMGDNRENSRDCREFKECVKQENIIGKCWLIKGTDNKLRKAC